MPILGEQAQQIFLDRELHEKAKTMVEKLIEWDFRCLTMTTATDGIKVQGPESLEQETQACDMAIFLEKLTAEVMVWLDYRRALKAWEPNTRAAKRLDDKKQEAEIVEV